MIYAIAFILGALGWTFVEYWLHRQLGHVGGAKNPFTVEHLAHHKDPAYFAPLHKKIIATALVGISTASLLFFFFQVPGLMAAAGFVAMYVTYEIIHRRLHTHRGRTAYGRWARRHHLYHHFRRPKLNHGVTTPIWDFVFRTLEVPDIVKVPRRNALTWMIDENEELPPPLHGDYELIGKKGKRRRPA